jgi:hypothetical protein
MTMRTATWIMAAWVGVCAQCVESKSEGFEIPESWFLALAQVESGDNEEAVGQSGERTRFQIMPRIARAAGVELGGGRQRSRDAAEKIWRPVLARYIQATNRLPTASDGYASWHRPGAFARAGYRIDALAQVVRARCERFENLVRSYAPHGNPPATGADDRTLSGTADHRTAITPRHPGTRQPGASANSGCRTLYQRMEKGEGRVEKGEGRREKGEAG